MAKFDDWNNQKIAAQCVFPRLNIDEYLEDKSYSSNIKKLVQIGVGGFCIFQGNIEKVKKIVSELQMFAEIPLLFCADFENGLQMRLEDGTSFPHSMALGKSKNYTSDVAQAIAKEAKDLGVFWNLAPVCDINSNPKNPVINIRSFGENAEIVSENIIKYIEATQKENVVACAKHFPGHGDTVTDSHFDFPILSKNFEELKQYELKPFISAINYEKDFSKEKFDFSTVKSIMLGHLIVEKIDSENPASLSKKVVDWLRNKLNYNGVTVTDGLDMKSITNKYNSEKIAELAINAGIDVLLIPENPNEIIEKMQKIIENNNNLKENLLKSVSRIYNLKVWAKLIPRFALPEGKIKVFSEHLHLALKTAVAATELIIYSNNSEEKTLKNEEKILKNLIPLPEKANYAAFSIIQKDEDIQAASRFFTMLASATENDCDYAYIDENISENEINDMKKEIFDAEFIIFSLFFRGRGYSNTLGSAQKINNIIKKIADNRNYFVIFFGDPYIANEIESNIKILAYSDSFASLASAVMKLTGRKIN